MSFEFAGYQQRSERFQQELESPMEDVLGATAEQAITESPIASILRLNELSSAKDSPQRLDAATARQRLKDAGLEGRLTIPDNGIATQALDILMDRKKEEIRRQDILSRAPSGFGSKAQQLGMAFAASALDPVNIGLAFVPIVGQARYMSYLAGARGILGRTAIRAGVGAAEGAAGAAIIEPLIYAAKTQEQADYDFQDSLLNVAFGTVFGGGLHTVSGGIADAARALRSSPEAGTAAARIDAMTPLEREAPMRTAVTQAMEGRQVDVEAVLPRVPDEERVIQAQVSELLAAKEAELTAATQGEAAFLVAASGDAQKAIAELQRTVELRDQIAAEIKVLPQDSPQLPKLIEQQAAAQKVVDSRRQRVDRLNSLRAAEADLEQLRYARSAAASIDDLVDALPTAQQAGFRRRIEQGRASGDVRSRGARLPPLSEPQTKSPTVAEVKEIAERQAAPVSQVTADVPAAQAADRQLAETPPATDPVAEQEALMADELAQLKEAAKVAAFDLGDELAEFDEAIKQAIDYAKAARAAVFCGMAH